MLVKLSLVGFVGTFLCGVPKTSVVKLLLLNLPQKNTLWKTE